MKSVDYSTVGREQTHTHTHAQVHIILTVNLGINLGEALPKETAHGALEVIKELLRGDEPPAGLGYVVQVFRHPVQLLLYLLWEFSLERLGTAKNTCT